MSLMNLNKDEIEKIEKIKLDDKTHKEIFLDHYNNDLNLFCLASKYNRSTFEVEMILLNCALKIRNKRRR